MTTLKFADTENMVAFLAKPIESEGIKQIVDFSNANPIRYALTINPTIYTSCIEKFWATVKAKTVNGEVQLQALVDENKSIIIESIVRKDLQLEDAEGVDCLPNATIFEQLTLMSSKTTAWNEFSSTIASAIIYEAVNEEMNDSLVRADSTASSLEVEQDSGNIDKTQSKATPNELSSSGTSSSGGPSRQETIRDIIAQTRSENVSKHSNDLLLARGNILQSGKDSLKLQELMALCTTLQSRVLALETTKTTQANEIAGLKRRVKKLERRNKSRTHGLKRLYKVGSSRRVESSRDKEDLGEDASKQRRRIHDIDADEDITLVNDDNEMFDVGTLTGDEVLAEKVVASKDVNLSVDEVTLAQALAALKSAKDSTATTTTATIPTPRKGIVFQELGTTTTTIISSQKSSQANVQDKGKGKMVEPEKPMKKKELIRLDEEIASKLQAEFDEEAKIEADHELAQRLQAQEQKELSDAEKARLFVQLLEKRRKHFAAKRAEEKRNKPLTRAQQRSIMCSYLKNMEGWKPKSLKNKSFANIQELFDKAMKRVNTFVDYRTELVEESSKKAEIEQEESSKKAEAEIAQESSLKRAWEELEQESSKRQKLEEDKESEELKQCLEIISDDGDDITIDATPLSSKSPTIMLKNFDREDLKVLWSIVKARFKNIEPVNYMDNILLLNLKTMFEHHVEDNVWKNQQGLVKVLNWKLYDSCGVHCVTMQNMLFYLLVEKMYPLTNHILHKMFNDVKLQVDYECEMEFELLRLVKKQLKEGYVPE
ncbi:hypothetical protein Tco_1429256 [Tanacetum coccineum]